MRLWPEAVSKTAKKPQSKNKQKNTKITIIYDSRTICSEHPHWCS